MAQLNSGAVARFMAFRRAKARKTCAANAPGGRTCPGCNQWRSRDDFHVDRTRLDGRAIYCKPCKRAQFHAWRGENLERDRARKREWRRAQSQAGKAAP